MVSSINSSNVTHQTNTKINEENVKNFLKYVNNESLKEVPDTFISSLKGGAGSAAVFQGIPVLNLLMKNKKFNGSLISDSMKSLGKINQDALKTLFKGEGKLSARILDYVQTAQNSAESFRTIKSAVKAQSKLAKLEEKAAKAAEKALSNSKYTKSAEKAAKKLAATKTTAKAAGNIAAAGTKAASISGKIKNLMKSGGAKGMLIFSGIIEGFTEVVPTFKELGAKRGIKQLGKSAVKVLGDTIGFVAGEQAGIALGTAIGTAICPGIGSAVGAVVGFATGCIGSWAAGKLTKKITGPSERELASMEQFNQSVKEIANNDEMYEELKTQAMAKVQEEITTGSGQLNEDSKLILELLENPKTSNSFAA